MHYSNHLLHASTHYTLATSPQYTHAHKSGTKETWKKQPWSHNIFCSENYE